MINSLEIISCLRSYCLCFVVFLYCIHCLYVTIVVVAIFFIIAVVQARDFVVEMNLNEMNDIFWSILHGIVIMDHIHFAYRITCKHLTIYIWPKCDQFDDGIFFPQAAAASIIFNYLFNVSTKQNKIACNSSTYHCYGINRIWWMATDQKTSALFFYFIIVYSIFFLFGVSKYAN